MPTQLVDMDALKEESIKGAIALLIQLLGDLCIGILTRVSDPWRPASRGRSSGIGQTVEEEPP